MAKKGSTWNKLQENVSQLLPIQKSVLYNILKVLRNPLMQRPWKLANRYCTKKIPKNTHKNIFDIHDIDIRDIYYTLSCSVSSSRSISGFELQHPDPDSCHKRPNSLVHASCWSTSAYCSQLGNYTLLFIRVHLRQDQGQWWQEWVRHHSLSNPSLVETFQPQYLATVLSDSRHADCDTLLQKILEVVSGGEHSN